MAEEDKAFPEQTSKETGLQAAPGYGSGPMDAPVTGTGYADGIDLANIREAFQGFAVNTKQKEQSVRFVNFYDGGITSKDPAVQFNVKKKSGATVSDFNVFADQGNITETQIPYRLGGILGQQGQHEFYKSGPSAADAPAIVDQQGQNVKKSQGYSRFVEAKPIIVTEVRVISANLAQLNQQWDYVTHNPNGIVTPDTITIAATRYKSDDASDLLHFTGCWLLDANHFLETTLDLADDQLAVQYTLTQNAIRNVAQFTQIV